MDGLTLDELLAGEWDEKLYQKVGLVCANLITETQEKGVIFDSEIMSNIVHLAFLAGMQDGVMYARYVAKADEKFKCSKCGSANIEDFHHLFDNLVKFVRGH